MDSSAAILKELILVLLDIPTLAALAFILLLARPFTNVFEDTIGMVSLANKVLLIQRLAVQDPSGTELLAQESHTEALEVPLR